MPALSRADRTPVGPVLMSGPVLLLGAAAAHGRIPQTWHRAWSVTVIVIGVASVLGGIARNRVPRDSGWWLFGWGLAWYAGGDVAWLMLGARLSADHPLTTLAWMVGIPGILVAIRGLRRVLASGVREIDREARLDAFIVALAVAYIGWHLTVAQLVREEGWLYFGVLGATPLWIIATMAMGLILGRGFGGGAGSISLWLLATAIPLAGLTSLVYWTVEVDTAWESAPIARVLMALAYAAVAAAASHPSMRHLSRDVEPHGPHRPRLLLVAAAASVVPIWHAADVVVDLPRPDVIGGGLGLAITGLAIARIAVTLRSREDAERVLRDREARFRSLAEHSYDYVVLVDRDARVTWGSDNTGGVTGMDAEAMHGRPVFEEVHPDDLPLAMEMFRRCTIPGAPGQRGTVRVRLPDGAERWIEFAFANQLDNPAVGGVVLNYRDVTDTHTVRNQLEHQATHDALTGLPNRAAFMARLDASIAAGGAAPALLFLDLDRFKHVNDSLGHAFGDRLLVRVADRLREVVHVGTIARLGGDEFVILVEDGPTPPFLHELAGRVCTALAQPLLVDGHEVSATASIGIAIAEPGQTTEDVLRDADTAMYRAKDEGRDGAALFDPAWRSATSTRLQVEIALRRALHDGRGLRLHHQPIVSLRTGQVTGLEALLRWDPGTLDGEDGTVPDITTAELIAVAEESGLIVPLGDWVVRQACADLAQVDRWHPGPSLAMSVNVSGAQLRRNGFACTVADALIAHDLAGDRLTVELTESVVVEDIPGVHATLAALRTAGVSLAMDDFGTGYSALANLKRLPFRSVKIDRSFVDGLGRDAEDTAIVNAVVGMAHALGLSVVAEGVETPAQLQVLRDLDCDHAQGYLLGRPVPLDELRARLVDTPRGFDGQGAVLAGT